MIRFLVNIKPTTKPPQPAIRPPLQPGHILLQTPLSANVKPNQPITPQPSPRGTVTSATGEPRELGMGEPNPKPIKKKIRKHRKTTQKTKIVLYLVGRIHMRWRARFLNVYFSRQNL